MSAGRASSGPPEPTSSEITSPLLREEEQNLIGVGTEPSYAIGQRALGVHSARQRVVDCVSMLEDGDLERISDLGGHFDRAWVSFMWRYPNLILLDEPTVLRSPGASGESPSSTSTAAGGVGLSCAMELTWCAARLTRYVAPLRADGV